MQDVFVMKRGCPNSDCSFYQNSSFVMKDGYYFRKNDSRKIARFVCRKCNKKFSTATFSLAFNHKKRRVNFPLFKLISSGMSMRRCARVLKIHRTTVKRKLIFLAEKSRQQQQELLNRLALNKVMQVQFDDLITSHHTKLKPLSVSAAVDAKNRFILGVEVSQIPAFGHLSELSKKKYGKRRNEHLEGLTRLFEKLKHVVHEQAHFKSDEHKNYPKIVEQYFPYATHERHKGGRACIAGQGELKRLHYDPLFAINHTYAMFRANVNRLFRKTWCTTKDPAMLKNHLDIFVAYFNQYLV